MGDVTVTGGVEGAAGGALDDRPLRLLLVEDNLVNQKLAGGLLSRLGVDVTIAGDGQRALDACAEGRFDLILMDVQMPVMGGIEATRCLRALEQEQGRPRTPILALSACAMAEDRDACRIAGMDDFIAKPFTKAALIEALARWGGGGG